MKLNDIYKNSELKKFAEEFSANYRTLSPGEYTSDGGNFHIRYKSILLDHYDRPMSTNARVGRNSGTIELDKSKLSLPSYTNNFVFFIIIWCVFEKEIIDYERADKYALKYYFENGKPGKDLLDGFEEMLKLLNSEMNARRLAFVKEIVSDEQKNKNWLQNFWT